MKKDSPVFILGNPRSGTSLLRIILNCHHNIVIPPECGFLLWWESKYGNWSYSAGVVDEFLKDLAMSKKIETWRLDYEDLKTDILNSQPSTYQDLCMLVYISYSKRFNKDLTYWGDKNNYYINHTLDLNRNFPRAKYIHLIRDGRDVACSYKDIKDLQTSSNYKPSLPYAIQQIAQRWVSNNSQVLALEEIINDNGRLLRIKFEDLLKNTLGTIEKVCNFLDLPVDPAMLNYHELNRHYKMEPEETLDWKRKTLEVPDESKIGRFVNDLTSDEIAEFEKGGSANAGKNVLPTSFSKKRCLNQACAYYTFGLRD